jgi:hypothetical protein
MNSKIQTADYIAEMILVLRNLAKGSDMHTLQGLLEIAYYEAYSVAHSTKVSPEDLQHLKELGEDARRHRAA